MIPPDAQPAAPAKLFYEDAYRSPAAGGYGGDLNEPTWAKRIHEMREETTGWLRRFGTGTSADEIVLELGCGLAYLADVHPGYVGLEYSSTAVDRVNKTTGGRIRVVCGDMQQLPFADDSVAAAFSWAALEHVLHPEKVFAEIARVLKPGGGAILAPAWHCRPWTVKKLELRPYLELTWAEKVEKLVIPIRDHWVWRAIGDLPARLCREAALLAGARVDVAYEPLSPHWELNTRYPHIADDDAVASINMHSAICHFRSRGWRILSHGSFRQRIMCRSGVLAVMKPYCEPR